MTDPARQTVSIEEIKDRLLARLDLLVHQLAPPAKGSYTKGGLYYTLNPGRADNSVGSFVVHMSGPKAGQWIDYAVPGREGRGDIIDLFGLAWGIATPAGRIKAAREWLGLDTEDPATRRAREAEAERLKRDRARQARDARARAEHQRRIAEAVWLSADAQILGTPVDAYLAGRGIDLRALPHLPRAIRFHPACRYYFDEELVDPETGEVRRNRGWRPLPAMVTAIARGPKVIDCHRTYLEPAPGGGWRKLAAEDAKKVFADYTGGSARLCGQLGPRGGMLKLARAPQGSRAFVAEGIENALSLIALRALAGHPPAFVVAACMGFNLAHVELPDAVTEVVLAADNDSHEHGRATLDRAVKAHRERGRLVRVWRSDVPGEDLNDALRRALAADAARRAG